MTKITIIVSLLLLAACDNNQSAIEIIETSQHLIETSVSKDKESFLYDGEMIVKAFSHSDNIEKSVIYTEETDPNELFIRTAKPVYRQN